MSGDIIKSFLVGLGFDIDESGLSKFNKSIGDATLRVAALGASIAATATAIGSGISSVSQDFEQLGYEYRIIAPAISRALALRRELLKAYSAAGINISRVVQQSVKLNFSLNKTRFAFKAIYESVAAKFFPLLTKQSDIFRKSLYAHLPQIQAALEKFVTFIFRAFDAIAQLGGRAWSILGRIYDFFVALDKATNGWSTIILGIAAAWKILNLEFLATPLGLLLTGLVALLALYDDFKTFEEGGKSLFNWGPVLPYINAISRGLDHLSEVFWGVTDAGLDLLVAMQRLLSLDFQGFWANLKDAAGAISGPISSIFGKNPQNVSSNIQNNPIGNPGQVNPIGSNVQNSSSNQQVQQQTTINVQGSADALSTGKNVANEQGRVNFDMARNLKGATR